MNEVKASVYSGVLLTPSCLELCYIYTPAQQQTGIVETDSFRLTLLCAIDMYVYKIHIVFICT